MSADSIVIHLIHAENLKSTKPKLRRRNSNARSSTNGHSNADREEKPQLVSNPTDEKFFSPRKLLNEYDNDLKNDDIKQKYANILDERGSNIQDLGVNAKEHFEAKQNVSDSGVTIFSPALKVQPPLRHSKYTVATTLSASVSDAKQLYRQDSNGYTSERSVSSWYDGEAFDDTEPSMLAYEDSIVSTTDEYEEQATTEATEFDPFYFMKSLPPYETIVQKKRPTVLPPRSSHTAKICLVLDLDETLVHCSVEEIENPNFQFDVFFNGTNYNVNVSLRPHMHHFLKRVTKQFELVVFTASQRVYAEKLLNLLDPNRDLIKYRLYREDCLEVDGNFLKDLNVLGRDLARVILVDNSPHAFGYQVNNGIPIESWFNDERDRELLHLLPFLESLVDVEDVRPVIERQFQISKLIDDAGTEKI
uniref:Nuclear LIM factor interactorinteracting protein hyphal form putative n=1 Tax=Albugo laibachii Nc14 TaxID=890382 RepID=F0W0J8_9STRA|nr:nuclear LIM factor interactorinteracting protein hyphal form putative [Albugo laibachii Nc14]|eukprot:CCA14570.1 nuclear LIM factor interactorinteracting protein hyphal form putative [Albugo laibachii Nc14]